MNNEIDSFKSILRTLYRDKRSRLTATEIQEKSQKINQNFINNLLPKILEKNSQAVFSLYISDGQEVLTNLIAGHFINRKINFSYPKIIQKHYHLDFVLNQPNQVFAPNKIYPKILEPLDGKKVLPDILILPLLAFDADLTRLGMGGGFFDRTIAFLKSNKKIITVALAYDFQRSPSLMPHHKTDQSLDFIVSETNIISAKPVSL